MASTHDKLMDAIADAMNAVDSHECSNYFQACGYGQK